MEKDYSSKMFAVRYYDGRFAVESYKTIKATLHENELKPFQKTIDNKQEYKTLFFTLKEMTQEFQRELKEQK